ncbi:MAG: hypothetical protein KatS3mg088_585 [Patescibacteria group bacterium]|nr:MAG: hypothetical protein KatS3mg088_585 [Patescibacteria group bacterium]
MAKSDLHNRKGKRNYVENLRENDDFLTSLASNINPLDLIQEIVGIQKTNEEYAKKDFRPGESIEISSIKPSERSFFNLPTEFSIFSQERRETERKIAELKAELKAIINEIKLLAKSTENVKEEIKAIPEQAPEDAGTYHLFFFEQILKIVRNARLQIEKASVWLEASSKRSRMKYWTRYKKHGSSFLLSADHYLTRSAG